MDAIYAMLFITFTFIGDPAQGVLTHSTVKYPSIFTSKKSCEEALDGINKQSTNSGAVGLCIKVSRR